jgi:hypothetical protein
MTKKKEGLRFGSATIPQQQKNSREAVFLYYTL